MDVTIKTVGRDQINAPSPLYKYRAWANDNHKSIVTDRIVWMAAPSSFEDEKEFRNVKRYDLMTHDQIYEKYLQWSKEEHPNWSRQLHRAHAREMAKHPPFKDPQYLKERQEIDYREQDKRLGVLSLTAVNDSLKMWNYYSDNGQGFSIGFDAILLFDYMGSGGEVVYPLEGLPIIHGNDSFEVHRWKQTYNKESKWSWEKEYRVELFDPNGLNKESRRVKLPSACYKEVIFGWAMSTPDREAVKDACTQSGLEVSYFEASVTNEVVTIKPI